MRRSDRGDSRRATATFSSARTSTEPDRQLLWGDGLRPSLQPGEPQPDLRRHGDDQPQRPGSHAQLRGGCKRLSIPFAFDLASSAAGRRRLAAERAGAALLLSASTNSPRSEQDRLVARGHSGHSRRAGLDVGQAGQRDLHGRHEIVPAAALGRRRPHRQVTPIGADSLRRMAGLS